MAERVGLVGAGVIGAGWAARLVLSGHDVSVADPSPDAAAFVERIVGQAVEAWQGLALPTDQRGELRFVDSVAEAVDGAIFVQESVPERLELKREVLLHIEAAAPVDTVIASSTSGFKPTDVARDMDHPGRLVVGHPYNPVYLLPVVEVVGGEQTADASVEAAKTFYRGIGMEPVHVRVEIDAFIGDRLLEAIWREAIWLVNDGVATTQEIDRVITHGFGLRWAQMGLFETYRVAGGSGGFRHFLAQFGPALEWPWTKLTDTPEWTDELVDRIVEQSDAHSGEHTTEELERIRDRNLVAFLRALEANDWGAGKTLAAQRQGTDA